MHNRDYLQAVNKMKGRNLEKSLENSGRWLRKSPGLTVKKAPTPPAFVVSASLS